MNIDYDRDVHNSVEWTLGNFTLILGKNFVKATVFSTERITKGNIEFKKSPVSTKAFFSSNQVTVLTV